MKLINPARERAFTLLEIMLVIAIITLLMGSAFMLMGDKISFGREARLQGDFTGLESNLKTYEMMNGRFPTTEQGLQALVTQPEADPKPTHWYQMMERIPKDPWGNDYIYVCPGKHNPQSFDIYSKGKDGIADTADDRGNWEAK